MDEPLGKSDEIRLSRKSLPVPWTERSALMARLEASDQRPAAEELRLRRCFTETQKPGVLAVIDAWLQEAGAATFSEYFLDFREELHFDVNERL